MEQENKQILEGFFLKKEMLELSKKNDYMYPEAEINTLIRLKNIKKLMFKT